MSRGFVLSALFLALVCSLRKESEIDYETSLVGPPLCDTEIVADMCKKLNQETVDYYGPTPNMDMTVVHAAELSEYFQASLRSIRFFLGKINATNKETDTLLLARHAFSVSCQELCDKTIASIPASKKPTYSDVGCYPAEGDSSSPSCTIDLSPVSLEKMDFESDDGSRLEAMNRKVMAETKPSENLQQQMEELLNAEKLDRSFTDLQSAFALMFRVYPVPSVTQVDQDEWPEGVDVPKEVGNASLLEEDQTLSSLSRSDVQVAVRLNGQARAKITSALRNVNARLTQRWFKSSDSGTISMVRRALNNAAGILSNVEYRNGFMCAMGMAAYVRPFPPFSNKFGLIGPYIVALCPPWYRSDNAFKIHALVHEAFHHRFTFTWDFGYGRATCLNLPAWKTKWNADSFAYFVCEATGGRCP